MSKKSFLLGVVLLIAGQLLTAQEWKIITLSADGAETVYAVTNVQRIVFENELMTVNMKSGDDVTDITRVSFLLAAEEVDYSKLRLNEVSGVGGDGDKFYELINIGDVDINLAGCKIYYNNDPFNASYIAPLTWTGCAGQIIGAGELLALIGRNNPCSFTTGLTAQRVIKVTLFDPDGNLIDELIRAQDTGEYDFGTTKSFSRIPDGTGPFYFTTPTPNAMNGDDATGLILVPKTQGTDLKEQKAEPSMFVFPNPVKTYLTVSGVAKDAKIKLLETNGTLLQTIISKDKSTDIDVSSLQQGTYLLQIGNRTVKFIKQ